MNKYTIIAKDDLETFPHTWTKGLDYEIVQKEHSFTLASNEGQLNFVNKVKDAVMENFEVLT
ncbi:hypothetical protein [Niallia taxi]|uniref:hypothetical protein n=1 Tax=Niallia taxi TaxID=2499688 RepID=UPI003009DBA9